MRTLQFVLRESVFISFHLLCARVRVMEFAFQLSKFVRKMCSHNVHRSMTQVYAYTRVYDGRTTRAPGWSKSERSLVTRMDRQTPPRRRNLYITKLNYATPRGISLQGTTTLPLKIRSFRRGKRISIPMRSFTYRCLKKKAPQPLCTGRCPQ